jgi:hypothetical protein
MLDQEEKIGYLFERQSDIQARIKKLENEVSLLEQQERIVPPAAAVAVDQLQDADGNIIQPDHAPTVATIGETIIKDEHNVDYQQFEAPEWCIPIKANVMTFDWKSLAKEAQFDCILMYFASITSGILLGNSLLTPQPVASQSRTRNSLIFV